MTDYNVVPIHHRFESATMRRSRVLSERSVRVRVVLQQQVHAQVPSCVSYTPSAIFLAEMFACSGLCAGYTRGIKHERNEAVFFRLLVEQK